MHCGVKQGAHSKPRCGYQIDKFHHFSPCTCRLSRSADAHTPYLTHLCALETLTWHAGCIKREMNLWNEVGLTSSRRAKIKASQENKTVLLHHSAAVRFDYGDVGAPFCCHGALWWGDLTSCNTQTRTRALFIQGLDVGGCCAWKQPTLCRIDTVVHARETQFP